MPCANLCTGVPGAVTLTYNGVMHSTVTRAAEMWSTGNTKGDFSVVPYVVR